MKRLDRLAFVIFYAVGLVLACVAYTVAHYSVAPLFIDNNPAYAEYQGKQADYATKHAAWQKKQDEWKTANHAAIDQRTFEEVIAGVKSLSTIKGTALEGIADSLRTLRPTTDKSGTDPHKRVPAILRLFYDGQHDKMVSRYVDCISDGDCKFTGPLVIMNDLERLNAVLDGRSDKIEPILPKLDLPPEPVNALEKERVPNKYRSIPKNRWRWELALVWLAFMIGFYGVGIGFIRRVEEEDVNAFTHRPDFLLAWLLLLPFIPSYLAGYLIYLTTLSTPFTKIRPYFILSDWGQDMVKARALIAQLHVDDTLSSAFIAEANRQLDNTRFDRLGHARLVEIVRALQSLVRSTNRLKQAELKL